MFEIYGEIERELRWQKLAVLKGLDQIIKFIHVTDDTTIQEQFLNLHNRLQPKSDVYIPDKLHNTYKFLLESIDPNNILLLLSKKSKFSSNIERILTCIEPVQSNLIHRRGKTTYGYFNGIVYKEDFKPDLYAIYFPRSTRIIYADNWVILPDAAQDLNFRTKKLKDALDIANMSRKTSGVVRFIESKKLIYNRYKLVEDNWQHIHARIAAWKPRPKRDYLNEYQINTMLKLGYNLDKPL